MWIVFGERFRDNKNANCVFHFLQARKRFGDCLWIRGRLLISMCISPHPARPVSTGFGYSELFITTRKLYSKVKLA